MSRISLEPTGDDYKVINMVGEYEVQQHYLELSKATNFT